MNRRRVLIGAGVLVGLAVLGLYVGMWLTAPPHRINWDGYRRIRLGMKGAEMEAIVGVPPGNYTTKQPIERGKGKSEVFFAPRSPAGWSEKGWTSDAGFLHVQLNPLDEVVWKEYGPYIRWSAPVIDINRRWLGL